MTIPAKLHANSKFPTATIVSALKDMDAGATLKATGAKYGMAFGYLHTLRKNRRRRTDAQAARPR